MRSEVRPPIAISNQEYSSEGPIWNLNCHVGGVVAYWPVSFWLQVGTGAVAVRG